MIETKTCRHLDDAPQHHMIGLAVADDSCCSWHENTCFQVGIQEECGETWMSFKTGAMTDEVSEL